MTLSMSQIAIPAFEQTISALIKILDKAEAHCTAKKIDPSVLLGARLYPDMLPLTRQIQIVSDASRGAMARLTGSDPAKWEDTEKSFADLKGRLNKTLEAIHAVGKKIDGQEGREVKFKAGSMDVAFKGDAFLSTWAFPNFFFHAATAYDILRHNGVEVGKRDFLNRA